MFRIAHINIYFIYNHSGTNKCKQYIDPCDWMIIGHHNTKIIYILRLFVNKIDNSVKSKDFCIVTDND